MKIQANKFALAAALSISISYAICALFCWLWPTMCLKLMADLFHMNNPAIVAPYFGVTINNFVSGLVQFAIYTYLIVGLWALFYNAFQD